MEELIMSLYKVFIVERISKITYNWDLLEKEENFLDILDMSEKF